MKSIMHLFEELIKESCGPGCVKILYALEGKEHVSEFLLAEKLDMHINELRIMLYKLTEYNLITSIRKKDKEKGWYVYYWTFNFRHARDLLIKYKEKKLEEFNHKLNHKEIPKYVCPHSCVSMSLEDAMEIEFKCPECGSLLKLKEIKYNEEIIKKKIIENEEDLEKIRQAIIVEVKPKEKVVKKKVKKKSKKRPIKKKVKTKKKPKKKQVKKKPTKKKPKKKPIKKSKPKRKPIKKSKPKRKPIKKPTKKKIKPKKKSKPIKKKPIKKFKPKKKQEKNKTKKKGLLRRIRKRIKF